MVSDQRGHLQRKQMILVNATTRCHTHTVHFGIVAKLNFRFRVILINNISRMLLVYASKKANVDFKQSLHM